MNLLICSHCGNKRFATTNNDIADLVEIKSAPLPARANGKNYETKEMPKKFKCPNCGFVMKGIKLQEEKKQEKTSPPPVLQEENEENDLKEFERYLNTMKIKKENKTI